MTTTSFSKAALSTVGAAPVALALFAQAAIDFTPEVNDYVAEGIPHKQLIFRDDKQRVEYEPPAGWKLDARSTRLRLIPPRGFSEATINVVPLTKARTLDENSIKELEQQFLAELPVGSQFAKIEQTVTNSVLVGGNDTVEVTASYQSIGEKFVKSALFVNLKNAQLIFALTAKKDDFTPLHRDFKSSIFTWHWVDPAQASQPVAATAPSSGSGQ